MLIITSGESRRLPAGRSSMNSAGAWRNVVWSRATRAMSACRVSAQKPGPFASRCRNTGASRRRSANCSCGTPPMYASGSAMSMSSKVRESPARGLPPLDPGVGRHGRLLCAGEEVEHRQELMSRRAFSVALGLTAVVFGPATRVRGDLVAGRGGNCAAVWDTFEAATTSSRGTPTLVCADGDESCDADAKQNGACVIRLNACVGRVTPSCPGPASLRSPLRIRGARLEGFEPPDPGAAPTCVVEGQLDL